MNPLTETALETAFQTGGGGGGTPYDSLYGEAAPERGIFFRIQVYEGVGSSLVEVYKRVGKSVVWVCKRAQGQERIKGTEKASPIHTLFHR